MNNYTSTDAELQANGRNGNGEAGWFKTALAFIIWVLVSGGFMGFAWLAIQDRMNGIDAWREKAVRDQRDGYRSKCEHNNITTEKLKEYLRQKQINVPPEYLIIEPCIQPEPNKLDPPKEN